jgi:hypothetical protein
MVDLETLGLDPAAVIVSIGAVIYDESRIDSKFYTELSIAHQTKLGRTLNDGTLAFWAEQSDAARAPLTRAQHGLELKQALQDLDTFIHSVGTDTQVWGNGAGFDLAILKHAYAQIGNGAEPWSHRQERCFRTLRALYPDVEREAEPAVEHNALDDAYAQALHHQLIIARIAAK